MHLPATLLLATNSSLKMFHLQPSRTYHRVNGPARLKNLYISFPFVQFAGKRILLINKTFRFESGARDTYRFNSDVA